MAYGVPAPGLGFLRKEPNPGSLILILGELPVLAVLPTPNWTLSGSCRGGFRVLPCQTQLQSFGVLARPQHCHLPAPRPDPAAEFWGPTWSLGSPTRCRPLIKIRVSQSPPPPAPLLPQNPGPRGNHQAPLGCSAPAAPVLLRGCQAGQAGPGSGHRDPTLKPRRDPREQRTGTLRFPTKELRVEGLPHPRSVPGNGVQVVNLGLALLPWLGLSKRIRAARASPNSSAALSPRAALGCGNWVKNQRF